MVNEMVSETVTQETRQGIIFVGRIIGKQRFGMVSVQLFIEGLKKPVGIIKIYRWEGGGSTEGLVDKAFQKWVINGLFHKTVKNPSILSVLTETQRERLEGVVWYRKTFRFLPTEDSPHQNPRFILTSDKSDLPDRFKRILEVGEEVVQHEEAEREEARKLRAKEEQDREENLRIEHAELIRTAAKAAINEKSIPADSIKTLSKLGLLTQSTTFRSSVLFPGESVIFGYDFTENEVRYVGYIGFDSDLQLLSVDERLPKDNMVYLKAST